MSYVLRVNAAEADAWVSKTLTDPEPEIWTTLVLDFPAASVAELVAAGGGFVQLSVLIDAATRVGGVGIDGGEWVSTSGTDGAPAAGVTTIEVQHKTNDVGNVYINGVLAMTDTDVQSDDAQIVAVGLIDSLLVVPCTFDITSVRVGRTRGTADLFFDNFDSGDLSKWTDTFGNAVVVNPALEPTVEIAYDGADTVTAVITNPAGARYYFYVDSSNFTDEETAATSPLTLEVTLSGLSPGDVFDAVVLPTEGDMGIGYTIFAYGTAAQITSEAAFRRDGQVITCDFVGEPGVQYELQVTDTANNATISAPVTGAGEATVTLALAPTAAPGYQIHQYFFAWVQVVGDYNRGLLATRLFDPDLDGAGFRGNPLGGTITWTNLGLPIRLDIGLGPASDKVLRTVADIVGDNGYADAWVERDLGALHSELWITFDILMTAAQLAWWQAASDGSPYLVGLSTDGGTAATISDIVAVAFIDDGGGWKTSYGNGGTPVADVWVTVEYHYKDNVAQQIYADSVIQFDGVDGGDGSYQFLRLGQDLFNAVVDPDPGPDPLYYRNVKVGTTRGASDIFADDFSSGDLSAWTTTVGDATVVPTP